MTTNNDEWQSFIELVRSRNPIEDVIEETGPEYKLSRKRGQYLRGEVHNSLVVRVDHQYYVWNSNSERGDVFNWVQVRRATDFIGALSFLAARVRLELPHVRNDAESQARRMAARSAEDMLTIAAEVMQAWLWKDEGACVYVRSRCWLDETVRDGMLGFSGRGTEAQRKDLEGELRLYGHELDSPLGVALLGFKGDVRGWGRAHQVEVQDNWVDWGMIPGLMGKTRLVYPHLVGGRVKYLSGRNILGAERNREGREIKSWNLPVSLAGQRQVFFNHVYARMAEDCVLVEGQGDAVTLAQWEIPAVATCGTSWQDQEELLVELRRRHAHVYLALDGDAAGLKALVGKNDDWPISQVLGAMTRVLSWPKESWEHADGRKGTVKDANDYLAWQVSKGLHVAPDVEGEEREKLVKQVKDTQRGQLEKLLMDAPIMAEACATWAGRLKGAKRDEGLPIALRMIGGMEKLARSQYRTRLAAALGVGIREYNDMLKAAGEQPDEAQGEVVETLGGFFDGWLVEYVYDPESKTARLAYRDPDRKVGVAESLEIGGRRYVPRWPGPFITAGAVLFASELGTLKDTRELAMIIETFMKKWYLMETRYHYRLVAYYVLMTWIYDAFSALCYLRATGEAGAGKSELMKRLGPCCYRFMPASGATTAASFFRAIEEYRGTLFIDEADLHDGGDMSNDLVKVLNLGAMKGGMIWRLEEVQNGDGKRYEVTAFNTYGPKLIAMRKEFRDDAVGSRSLTLKVQPREPIELKQAGVPLAVNAEFWRETLAIRNLALRWRMHVWEPEIELMEDDMDLEISARLNQVTMPIKALAREDAGLRKEIESFLRAYNQETVLTRSMTIAARIVEAMWKIHQYPDLRLQKLQTTTDGDEFIMVGDVRTIANELMDEMNSAGEKEATEGEEDKKDWRKKKDNLTARGVGSIVRNELQLHVGARRGNGFPIFWDQLKMEALAKRYGVNVGELPGVEGNHERHEKHERVGEGNHERHEKHERGVEGNHERHEIHERGNGGDFEEEAMRAFEALDEELNWRGEEDGR